MQYKAKSDPLKGQSSETSGLNYGIFPYTPPQERKRLTGNKLIADKPYLSQICDITRKARAKAHKGLRFFARIGKVLQVINTIFPVGVSAKNSHSAVSKRD
ncbi:MAG TPA: hypothetical protein H9850_10250 [Candidatus Anaerobiospirillum pullistercoris]|uniref:Uncharacterized protein n=1 Tax=Candidatus Anaerobiospirillum pullistercoris TaxID=2838452 RepID=A0A9D2B2B1_9GAMM|nr:hypothetical protein [Candidatus Anaerobiospirillum pullistercoris]